MKNSKILFQEIANKITSSHERSEVESITCLLLEHLFDLTRTQILAEKTIEVTDEHTRVIELAIEQLNLHVPIQHVIGREYFFGRKFIVNSSVLIPRPETEELVQVVINEAKAKYHHPKVLDVGTGSGCIAITLALEIDGSEIFASDISNEALAVAKENAHRYQADINFLYHSILEQPLPFSFFDIIVSNPPYITEAEKREMDKHVIDFEPHLALFVPDDDPIIYYKAIATQAQESLKPGGLLAVEINSRFVNEVAAFFQKTRFKEVEVVKDLSGKDRIVKGFKI